MTYCFFFDRIQRKAQAAVDAEYPSYGVSGPGSNKTLPKSAASDRKLAQSAQMFHYQQQRQQMMAQEKFVLINMILIIFYYLHYYFSLEVSLMQDLFTQMIQMTKHLVAEIIQFMNVLV